MATDLGVTGMDYEIFLNHTVPEKTWNVYLQENHINASRGESSRPRWRTR